MEGKSPLSYKIYRSIHDIDSGIWNGLNHEDKTCLSTPFLQALEDAPPPGMKFLYGIFFYGGRPVGIAVFQLLPLRMNMVRRNLRPEKALKSKGRGIYLLICGNTLLSGEYGFVYSTSLETGKFINALDDALKEIRRTSPPSIHILCSLIKDMCPQNAACPAIFHRKYYGFSLSPNMMIRNLDRFSDFFEFRNSMKSKYRRNVKAIENRGADLIRKDLSLAEIKANRLQIYDLYFQVHQKATFRICTLHPYFFERLKEKLPERFTLTAYYQNKKMLAFTTRIQSHKGRLMEGYTHGLLQSMNKSLALYQNILLDDIKTAMDRRIPHINLGRTSIGMKSAFGAETEPLYVFACIKKPLIEGVILPHLEMAIPDSEPCRRPFAQ